MSRTISVADDVYEWMNQEKGDRSFSELIRSLRDMKSNFSEVNGIEAAGDMEEVEETVEKASEKVMDDLEA